MLIEIAIYVIAVALALIVLVALPLNVSRKVRLKVLLISALLVLLTYILYLLYSILVSLISIAVLLFVFSYLLAKELAVDSELPFVEDEDTVDEEDVEVEPVIEEHIPSSDRLKQESIDQLLKEALQEDQEGDPSVVTEADEVTESTVDADKQAEQEKEDIDAEDMKVDQDQGEDTFENLEDVEEIFQSRPRSALLSNEVEEEGESLLSHAEVHHEEDDEPMLGRQFAEQDEEDALPPRASAFGDEQDDQEEGTPLLGRQFEDDDDEEEGLPPRPSAFDSEEMDVESEPHIDSTQKLDDTHELFVGRELEDDSSVDEIAVTFDIHAEDDKEELRDELNLRERKLVEVEEEFIDRKKSQGEEVNDVEDNETSRKDELAEKILLKRSEMFDRLEDDLFDDKK